MVKRIAAIDIGTNSVLLTIAKIASNQEIVALHEEARITRIGEGLSASKRFRPKVMERTLEVIREYQKVCRENGVDEIYTVGTAAMRGADNADEFIGMVRRKCGLDIEVISGEREAELTFRAVEADFGGDVIVVDIGGGSTEIVCPGSERVIKSIPLGCVTLQERFGKTDPISDDEFEAMCHELRCQAPVDNLSYPQVPGTLVATAGTATTLAAMKLRLRKYNHSDVHGLKLNIADINNIIDALKSRTIEERKNLPGLEPARADVILPGALILRTLMEKLGFHEVTVSDRGLRWGLLYEIISYTSESDASPER